jgi:hypothetical protein
MSAKMASCAQQERRAGPDPVLERQRVGRLARLTPPDEPGVGDELDDHVGDAAPVDDRAGLAQAVRHADGDGIQADDLHRDTPCAGALEAARLTLRAAGGSTRHPRVSRH